MAKTVTEPTEDQIQKELAEKLEAAKKKRAEAFEQAYATICKTYACRKSPVVIVTEAGVQCALNTIVADQ